jgi:AbrB family looped-hinge helix DNA binding protein
MVYGNMGLTTSVKVDERRRITIPEDITLKLGLNSGDFVIFSEENGFIVMMKGRVLPVD